MSPPALVILRAPGLAFATLTGCPRLTAATAPVVRAALAPLADEPGDVSLDLGGVEFISSDGLIELVHLHRRVRARGGRLTVVHSRPPVREVLAVTGLDRLFAA
jgi:anti-sigma B factor antagonist